MSRRGDARSSSGLSTRGTSARSARRRRPHARGADLDRRTLGEAGGAIRNDGSLAARRRSREKGPGAERSGSAPRGRPGPKKTRVAELTKSPGAQQRTRRRVPQKGPGAERPGSLLEAEGRRANKIVRCPAKDRASSAPERTRGRAAREPPRGGGSLSSIAGCPAKDPTSGAAERTRGRAAREPPRGGPGSLTDEILASRYRKGHAELPEQLYDGGNRDSDDEVTARRGAARQFAARERDRQRRAATFTLRRDSSAPALPARATTRPDHRLIRVRQIQLRLHCQNHGPHHGRLAPLVLVSRMHLPQSLQSVPQRMPQLVVRACTRPHHLVWGEGVRSILRRPEAPRGDRPGWDGLVPSRCQWTWHHLQNVGPRTSRVHGALLGSKTRSRSIE